MPPQRNTSHLPPTDRPLLLLSKELSRAVRTNANVPVCRPPPARPPQSALVAPLPAAAPLRRRARTSTPRFTLHQFDPASSARFEKKTLPERHRIRAARRPAVTTSRATDSSVPLHTVTAIPSTNNTPDISPFPLQSRPIPPSIPRARHPSIPARVFRQLGIVTGFGNKIEIQQAEGTTRESHNLLSKESSFVFFSFSAPSKYQNIFHRILRRK